MTPEQRTISRIVKVNHAGEFGAIRIYRSQLWIAQRLYPDVVPFLRDTLGHENRHCRAFRAAMPSRQSRPCRIMALWGNGGYVLGLVTGLMGRQGIWICTEAVEQTVHRHLEDQLPYLSNRDETLKALIVDIQRDELQHLSNAQQQLNRKGWFAGLLNGFITAATEAVIWLSTWGDSSRMARDIRK